MSAIRPEHWNSFTGLANWFEIRYPPSWRLEQTADASRLVAPGNACTLTLSVSWTPPEDGRNLEQIVCSQGMPSHHRHVRPATPLDIEYPSFCLEGEARLGPARAWWKRLLFPARWRHWRMWAVRHNNVCLLATLSTGPKRDQEMETVAAMILRTVSFAHDPADPPGQFADRVVRLARDRFPLVACRQTDEFQIQFGDSSVNLFNFYRAFVNDPESFEQIMLPTLTTVVRMQELGSDQAAPQLDRVRDRIMPMLYPESAWRSDFPNFVGLPWVAGLGILYVVDETQAYWYIREDLLDRWQINIEQLHELAVNNLEAYFREQEMEIAAVTEEEGPQLVMPHNPDAYNTARLISPDFHRKMRELLGGEFVVGVPSRDFFVAFSLDSPESTELIRRKVAEDFTTMDHPLSERLLYVTLDGVSEYCPEWTT